MTLAEYLKELRARRGLSLRDVGDTAGIQRATVWKVENGHLPKGGTLMAILTGLKAGPETADGKEAVALWTNERTRKGLFRPNELAGILTDQMAANSGEMREFLRAVAGMSREDFGALVYAVANPDVLRALVALHRSATSATR